MNDPITVESLPLVSLKAVQLRPGDVIVLTFPDAMSPRDREYWGGVLEETFPEHQSLLLADGADLSILRTEPQERPKTRPFPKMARRA